MNLRICGRNRLAWDGNFPWDSDYRRGHILKKTRGKYLPFDIFAISEILLLTNNFSFCGSSKSALLTYSVLSGYRIDNGYNVKRSDNGVAGMGSGVRPNPVGASQYGGQQQPIDDHYNYGLSGEAENLINPSSGSNHVEDHYHNRSTIQKSVGWATEDNLIQEER